MGRPRKRLPGESYSPFVEGIERGPCGHPHTILRFRVHAIRRGKPFAQEAGIRRIGAGERATWREGTNSRERMRGSRPASPSTPPILASARATFAAVLVAVWDAERERPSSLVARESLEIPITYKPRPGHECLPLSRVRSGKGFGANPLLWRIVSNEGEIPIDSKGGRRYPPEFGEIRRCGSGRTKASARERRCRTLSVYCSEAWVPTQNGDTDGRTEHAVEWSTRFVCLVVHDRMGRLQRVPPERINPPDDLIALASERETSKLTTTLVAV